MESRLPKAKRKSVANIKLFDILLQPPLLLFLLLLFIIGTTSCESNEQTLELFHSVPNFNLTDFPFNDNGDSRWRNDSLSLKKKYRSTLSDIRYLRRHLNREIVNFIMRDTLVDGEIENRVHFNGITAKETYVGTNG